jgi:hypothetical protein
MTSLRIKMLLLMVVSMVSMGMAAVTGVTGEGKSLFPTVLHDTKHRVTNLATKQTALPS